MDKYIIECENCGNKLTVSNNVLMTTCDKCGRIMTSLNEEGKQTFEDKLY